MTENITRNDIAESIFDEIGLSRNECNQFVDDIIDIVLKEL